MSYVFRITDVVDIGGGYSVEYTVFSKGYRRVVFSLDYSSLYRGGIGAMLDGLLEMHGRCWPEEYKGKEGEYDGRVEREVRRYLADTGGDRPGA